MNILAYFVNYFWQHSISREAGFNLHKWYPQIPLVTGLMGTFFLFMSTATIDTGIMAKELHIKSAGLCFIFTIISCIYNTVICWQLYTQTKKVTTLSIALKVTLSLLLIYQLYLQLTKASGFFIKDNSDLGHIL